MVVHIPAVEAVGFSFSATSVCTKPNILFHRMLFRTCRKCQMNLNVIFQLKGFTKCHFGVDPSGQHVGQCLLVTATLP